MDETIGGNVPPQRTVSPSPPRRPPLSTVKTSNLECNCYYWVCFLRFILIKTVVLYLKILFLFLVVVDLIGTGNRTIVKSLAATIDFLVATNHLKMEKEESPLRGIAIVGLEVVS